MDVVVTSWVKRVNFDRKSVHRGFCSRFWQFNRKVSINGVKKKESKSVSIESVTIEKFVFAMKVKIPDKLIRIFAMKVKIPDKLIRIFV